MGVFLGDHGKRRGPTDCGRAAMPPFWSYAAFLANLVGLPLIGARGAVQPIRGHILAAGIAVGLLLAGRVAASMRSRP